MSETADISFSGQRIRHFLGFTTLFTYMAGMEIVYEVISFLQNGEAMTLGFFPWVCWVLTDYGISLFLLRRGVSASFYIGMHAVSAVLLSAGEILIWGTFHGWMAILFALCFYGITVMLASDTARNGVKANQKLTETEVMLLILGILLFLEEAGAVEMSGLLLIGFLAFFFSLLSLVFTRILTDNPVRFGGSRLPGILLLGTLFFLIALAGAAFAVIFTEDGQELLRKIVSGAVTAGQFLLGAAGRFLAFLLSLFPAVQESGMDLGTAEELNLSGGDMTVEMPDYSGFLIAAAVLLAACLIVFLIFLMIRFRKVRIGGQFIQEERSDVKREGQLMAALKALFSRLKAGFIFRLKCLTHPDSMQVLLLTAEKAGKRRKLPRRNQESPGAYFRRLEKELREYSDGRTEISGVAGPDSGISEKTENRKGFLRNPEQEKSLLQELPRMAEAADRFFYAPSFQPDPEQIRGWKKLF